MLRRLCLSVLLVSLLSNGARADTPQPITPQGFETLHKSIKPQPGESLFWQIPWLLDTWEARQKAATAGKPILVWC